MAQTFRNTMVFVLIAAALLTALFYATTPVPTALQLHADDKHGASAEAVRQAVKQNTIMTVTNSTTGRKASICQLPNGIYGARITEADPCLEVTAFPKEKMKTLDQILRYFKNRGYSQ